MGIHSEILDKVKSTLEAALITNISASDTARAGIVKIGPLQGDPDPDLARISVTVHENDPDKLAGGGEMRSASFDSWDDYIVEIETGAVTWCRRFSVKARCLFENTREDLEHARDIASVVRDRIEDTLLSVDWGSVHSGSEYVSRGVIGENIGGEMLQSGGPPDSYDFHIKIRFEVLTTRTTL